MTHSTLKPPGLTPDPLLNPITSPQAYWQSLEAYSAGAQSNPLKPTPLKPMTHSTLKPPGLTPGREAARTAATQRGREADPNLRQSGGAHYLNKAIQPWEAMEAWMSHEEFVGFLRGNVIKYAGRAGSKEGVPALADYEKALHYLEKLILVLTAKRSKLKPEPIKPTPLKPMTHSTRTNQTSQNPNQSNQPDPNQHDR